MERYSNQMDGFNGRAVANFILDYCDANGIKVTNLALQKLVYFCHAWSLIELQKPLCRHSFEAWEFGPVLPYLYHDFKCFDRLPILNARAKQFDPLTGENTVVGYEFDTEVTNSITKTLRFYTLLRAGELVELSHARGGPWHKAWHHTGVINSGMKISNQDIREFYSKSQDRSN